MTRALTRLRAKTARCQVTWRWLGVFLVVGALLSACAAQRKVDDLALSYGFERTIIHSGQFNHLVYSANTANPDDSVLHVYLEGDGSPWIRPSIFALDPTGSEPLALQLMALDTQPSVYIGRPCYHGFYQDKNCTPLLWTHARYAQPVVDSMAVVLQKILEQRRASDVYLIGYSGGGVLAMLLAEKLTRVRKVITIAANLDIAAWTQQHDFSPLRTSLNPATRLARYRRLPQHHLAGRQDENVNVAMIERFAHLQDSAQVKLSIFDEFDHKCCWVREWPRLLRMLFANSSH